MVPEPFHIKVDSLLTLLTLLHHSSGRFPFSLGVVVIAANQPAVLQPLSLCVLGRRMHAEWEDECLKLLTVAMVGV